MPIYCYFNPNQPSQKYWTALVNDPNIPAGYLDSQGSDGAIPAATQRYVAGVNSGGFPKYKGDPTQRSDYPNGILF